MRSTDYATIERGVASIAGIEPDNILAHEKTILADYITDATKFCWDYHPWGECTITEKRYFKDIWTSALAYDIGHEVYHDGVFYRNHSAGNSNPSELIHWYEIGDNIAETEWQEDGLYSIGARVGYNGKSYACKKVSQLGKANFSTDGIEVTNSEYFVEVDTFFERFIDYEQTGKNVIENCLGVYTSDPRYTNAKHLNFREGREGIYIEAIDGIINEFWMTYKIASPVFTSTETSGEIPRFLTQAIKAHAYQSFLIGEGQHEKAQLQELKILDLLVREVDKIDLQANKNKPYSIEHTSHRIINSRQGQTTASTPHLVNTLREGQSDLTFKIGTSVEGRNAFKMSGSVSMPMNFLIVAFGRKGLQKARNASAHFIINSSVSAISFTGHSITPSVSLKLSAQAVGHRLRFITPNINFKINCNNVSALKEIGKEGLVNSSLTIKTDSVLRGGIGAFVRARPRGESFSGFNWYDSVRSGSTLPSLSRSTSTTTSLTDTELFRERQNHSRSIIPNWGGSYVALASNSPPNGMGIITKTLDEFLAMDFGQGKGNTIINSEYLKVLNNTVYLLVWARSSNGSTTFNTNDKFEFNLPNGLAPLGLTFAYYTDHFGHGVPSASNASTMMVINTINLNIGAIGGSTDLGNSSEFTNASSDKEDNYYDTALLLETSSTGHTTKYQTQNYNFNQTNSTYEPTGLVTRNTALENYNSSNLYGDYSAGQVTPVPYILPSAVVNNYTINQSGFYNWDGTEIDGGDKYPNRQLLNRTLQPSDYKV